MSLEMSAIVNDPQNINLASKCIKNWPDKIKDYSLKDNYVEGQSLTLSKNLLRIEKNGQ